MSETLQLNPPIPVWVCRDGQWRKALAHFRIDYGIEHHTMWGTFDDKTGEPWDAPNPCVRIRENWSAGRHRVSLPGNVVSDLMEPGKLQRSIEEFNSMSREELLKRYPPIPGMGPQPE